jgi:chemotaxis protein methyltransferase CheR
MLSQDQFSALSNLLKDETAVVLETGKEYLVESRLTCLAREEGFTTISDLIDTVLRRSNPGLNQKVLLALTTNETSFFRDLGAFEFLKSTVIPNLMRNRASTRSLTLWSAACSTGQEPYSIAMSLKDNFQDLDAWKVQILASDLNPRVVSKAAEGVYTSLEVNRGLPIQLLVKYFTQDGDFYKLHQEIKSKVSFFQQNLISPWPTTQVDVLFMRNVLIYFDTETKRAIFEKIKTVLAPDGYLFLGTAETPYRIVDGFVKVGGGINVYQQEVSEHQQKEKSKLKV